MRVHYSHGGAHALLIGHTYYQKDHGILARSWEQVERVFYGDKFQRHLREEGDFRVTLALDIEIVQPSRDAQQELFAAQNKADRETVRRMLCGAVAALPEPWPSGFSRCAHYASVYGVKDAYSPDEHHDCRNCVNGVTVRRTRFLELYAQFHATPKSQQERAGLYYFRSPHPRTRAPYADPNCPLFELSGAHGVRWAPVHTVNGVVSLDIYSVRNVMFYAHVSAERADRFAQYQKACQELNAEITRECEMREQREAEERVQQDAQERLRLRKFLGGS